MIVFVGDIHGNFRVIENLIGQLGQGDNIIQVGDFGLGFKPLYKDCESLSKLGKLLSEKGVDLYIIRGNHDDPEFWEIDTEKNCKGSYAGKQKIHLVPDYTTLNIENKTILFIGGAVSVDRKDRKEGVNYWVNEVVRQNSEFEPNPNVDIVVTHTAPYGVPPLSNSGKVLNYYKQFDDNLIDDIAIEREYMNYLFNLLYDSCCLEHWIYGHFHFSETHLKKGVKFRLLDINEKYHMK